MGSGALVLVGTPIGNLGDLSPRAVDELRRADVIACEDTRRTGRMLAHAGIDAPQLLTLNEHTEAARVPDLLDRLGRGQRIAVVTDAGMPGISDPGARAVRAASDAGFAVEVVPGPSAVVTAVALSGLTDTRFVFEGFLPRKGTAREARLDALADEPRTIVLYEAPHRIERTLGDLTRVLGADRPAVVARELTKLHEEVWRGSLAEAAQWAGDESPRGELVVVVEGAPPSAEPTDDEVREALADRLDGGLSTRDAVAAVAAELGVAKRRVYDLAIEG